MSHVTWGHVEPKNSSGWSHVTRGDELNEMGQYDESKISSSRSCVTTRTNWTKWYSTSRPILVLYHSNQFSTRPSKMLKCHGGHGNFCKVLNSFSDHVPNIEIFRRLRRKAAENFPKIWTCHGKFGRLPKPKFRQACHRSHPLPNWFEQASLVVASQPTPQVWRWGFAYINILPSICKCWQRFVSWSISQALSHSS